MEQLGARIEKVTERRSFSITTDYGFQSFIDI